MAAGLILAQTVREGPVQPIPFNHKLHLANGLECKTCHEMPDPGEAATIPATAKCMACHTAIKKDSPEIQKLADFHAKKETIPWRRVYRVPDYVYFSHKEHLKSGKATCETCHGDVRQLEVMRKVKETSMAACIDCHKTNSAPVACDYCHATR
jgi:Cytochrome c7 and related cytochrome c/Class III cytochrome C family